MSPEVWGDCTSYMPCFPKKSLHWGPFVQGLTTQIVTNKGDRRGIWDKNVLRKEHKSQVPTWFLENAGHFSIVPSGPSSKPHNPCCWKTWVTVASACHSARVKSRPQNTSSTAPGVHVLSFQDSLRSSSLSGINMKNGHPLDYWHLGIGPTSSKVQCLIFVVGGVFWLVECF